MLPTFSIAAKTHTPSLDHFHMQIHNYKKICAGGKKERSHRHVTHVQLAVNKCDTDEFVFQT
jgi:hypothetical protein